MANTAKTAAISAALLAAFGAGFGASMLDADSVAPHAGRLAATTLPAREAEILTVVLPPHCTGTVRFYEMPDGLQYTDDASCGGPVRNLEGGAEIEADLVAAGAANLVVELR